MKSVHTCEICGNSSTDEGEIRRCEAQGVNEPLYPIGTSVELCVGGEYYSGVVTEIIPGKKTHILYYTARVSEATILKLGANGENDNQLGGFLENQIRKVG